MDRFVARLNIEHFQKLLVVETDETKRRTLRTLLEQEEARLASALERVAESERERSGKKA